MERAFAGVLLAGALAIGARRGRSLTTGGAIAAAIVGAAAVLAGWTWAALLMVFFLSSTLLSRYHRATRNERIAGIVEKGDERDAAQVFANGGVFAAAAVIGTITGNPNWAAVSLGALAAATADTWATEVGTLAGRPPRSIFSLKVVDPGTSGGVTLPGTLASLGGAALIALTAGANGLPADPFPVFVGGLAGSVADSLAGATVQERRWCDRCGLFTERRMHTCGSATRATGGVRGLRNDLVNLVCTLVGGGVALVLAR